MLPKIYDLHTHILPGLDDGSPDNEVSRAMLQMAAECGTTDVFATPHIISGSYLPEWNLILNHVEELNQFAADAGLGVRIQPGAEVAMDWSLLDRLPTPGPYCLGGGRFILVELPLGSLPTYVDEFLFTLQARDFQIVLAHPERCPQVKKDPARLQPWLEAGMFVQINASSLTGKMGSRTQETAVTLLETGRVNFVGSDAHGVGMRRPDLREAALILERILGEDGARMVLDTNPAQLLANLPDEIRFPLITPHPKRRWTDRLSSLWRK